MRWATVFLAFGIGMVSAIAKETPVAKSTPPALDSQRPAFRESVAPPGTQRAGPAISGTVITESTPAGRKAPAHTADRPAYYVSHPGGRRDFGQVLGGENAPTAESLNRLLEQALVAHHFLPADASHPASLLLVFSWGVHRIPSDAEDPGYGNTLDRAALVGGQRFAEEFKKALQRYESAAGAASDQTWGARLPGMSGISAAGLFESVSPVEMFRKRDLKTELLMDRIDEDCYYVVISAFDYSEVARGGKLLLWRTKLTAVARGVSMADAIPGLIEGGAGYLGREMKEAEFFTSSRPSGDR